MEDKKRQKVSGDAAMLTASQFVELSHVEQFELVQNSLPEYTCLRNESAEILLQIAKENYLVLLLPPPTAKL